MFDRPRNWKWMVPAALSFPAFVLWSKAYFEWGWGDWSLVFVGLAIVLGVAFVVNLWVYVADYWSDTYANIRMALNTTPEVRMFEAAKGMHPDAVRALLEHRRTIWRLKYVPQKNMVDWILDEAPSVHAGFVDFVLDHSNGSLMPKHGFLSEGSKRFDPEGIVTDYQQYDDLVLLLQAKLMATAAYGNQAPKLIPPWTVELLRHRFGLDGEGYDSAEEMSVAMRAVVKEHAKDDGGRIRAEGGRQSGVPDVIAQALDGLEQTAEMRARMKQ